MKPNYVLLFVTILLRHPLAQAISSCEDAPRGCDCLPNLIRREIELQCPTTTNREAVLQYKLQTLHVTCFNSSFELGSLDLKMKDLQYLNVYNCTPINDLFFGQLTTASDLTNLVISNSNFEDTHIEVLHRFTRNLTVESITLDNNKLRKFPDVFSDLYELDLTNNFIEKLPDGLNFSNLVVLILKNNSIRYLNDFVFDISPNLKYIDLSHNNIVNLPPRLLYPLKELKVLLLSSNGFSTIPEGFLGRNSALLEVTLSNGFLNEIGTNMFSNCTQLEKLRLANNSLENLPRDIFLNMKKLKYLELSMNMFSNFSQDSFKGLTNLRQLFLIGNRLRTWSSDYNRDLSNLFRLQLNNNSLSRIGDDTFSGLDNLKFLDLSHNEISTIELTAFANLKDLTELNLSFNKLETPDATIAMPSGRRADIKRINLSYNTISRINVPNLNRGGISPSKYLCLSGNPINCDCEIFDLLKYMKGIGSKTFEMLCNEECASPPEWKGIKLKEIDLDKFTCEDVKSHDCPGGCNCRIHPASQILKIDCSDAGLLRPPTLSAPNRNLFSSSITLKEIWVDLSNNSISKFTVEDYTYRNVNVLNLSNNTLRMIDWIPPNLEVLNLDNNILSDIDTKMVDLMNKSSTLRRVTLEENPWSCDCKMVEFADTLRIHLMKMVPNNNLTCSDGSLLMELNEATACRHLSETFIALIVILSLIVLLSIVFLILYFQFQDYLKIWLYNHKLLLWLIKETDIDTDKIYDAFISYSHKDEKFIVDHLLPELENGQEKYKLCLHERDWIVGEYIPKQIADSVENSRRTIVVLSRNFLASEWTNIEFETAHSKTLHDGKNRLIVILYEDIEVSEISNEQLKIYLNTKTYIKWGDPWFWKKLKQAMPASRNNRISKRKSKRVKMIDVENCIKS